MKLDSIYDGYKKYQFEYYPDGKLKSDYGYIYYPKIVSGRIKYYLGFEQYFYNGRGDCDSINCFYMIDTGRVDRWTGWIHYEYDSDGKILTKTRNTSFGIQIKENSYDSFGNLIQNKISETGIQYPTYNVWKYDSLIRLILKKSFQDIPNSFYNQYVYKYNSDGTIDCTTQQNDPDTSSYYPIRIVENYHFQFDQDGKLINQTHSYNYNYSDSTWKISEEIPLIYDSNGRIIDVVYYDSKNLFHYNSDGNLDSLWISYADGAGYLSDRVVIVDIYGNRIVPQNLGIIHFYYSSLVTGIKHDENNIEMNFNLYQNYPIPFNPTTTIKYAVPKSGLVQIKVYDILGQEIATLVNQEKQIGTYKVEFNGSKLSS